MICNQALRGWTRGAAAALALGTLASAAHAVPSALWAYGAYGYYNPYTGVDYTVFSPGSLSHVDANAAFASMASMNGPVAQAYVDTAGTGFTKLPNAGVTSSAAVQYDFYVTNGMTFSDLVPITIKGRFSMEASGAAVASGYARVVHSATAGGVNNHSFSNQSLGWGCGGGASDCGLFDFEIHINVSAFAAVEPGEIARVNLFAKAQNPNASEFATQASAWVDPLITIDASYLASHPDASLVMDASINNMIGAVPEPASVAMLLAGLGVVGAAARRRSAG